MASPFPGMNPYLEASGLWRAFHHCLIVALGDVLRTGLGEQYGCRVGQRRYMVADLPGQATKQQTQEEYLEILDHQKDRVVTLVDVVSPANKVTPSGRQAYLETRQTARDHSANMVEIDLVLQGQPMLRYTRQGLPDWDYAVTVTRYTQPERYEIYTTTLQKRLPRFRLPLANDNRDIVIDLNNVFSRAFEGGAFASKIDYKGDPPPEVVSTLAYRIWEREGRPGGRATVHWYRAIAELREMALRKAPIE
ncbi:MAG TPA: DUF4058 family protein [Gemmataceae bacterium]|nr:DUF4058 family protein [Gemmataceae bacterium]